MSKTTVVLAEKPSQARDYANSFHYKKYKDGYIKVKDDRFFKGSTYITWGFGHLVELAEPETYDFKWKKWDLDNLPIIPNEFKYNVPKDKQKQFSIVKNLLEKSDEIIIATDADREGENIARSIIKFANCEHKPIKRLWINSLEDAEIQKGFLSLQNGDDYIPFYNEAQTRQFGDWLVGINASRLYSLLLQQKGIDGSFSVGRVQTPTLYMIYKREEEIKEFVPKTFYELYANVKVNDDVFEAKHNNRFYTKEEMISFIKQNNFERYGNKGVISKSEKRFKKTLSPRLHSLSTLQSKINKKYGYSANEVLKIAQSLYEKKLISYPRTSCHFITENEFDYLKRLANDYADNLKLPFEMSKSNARKRYVDNKKVQEHYALIPTRKIINTDTLSDKERNIYEEIVKVTLSMFLDDYTYEEAVIDIEINGVIFSAKGKVEVDKGWKVLFPSSNKQKDTILPPVSKDDECLCDLKVKDGKTTPPKRYTEGQLIQAMKYAGREVSEADDKEILKETDGIGTEATRASIIETLKGQGYVKVEKKTLIPTQKGEILCQAIEGTLLSSPEMTAKWEKYLKKIGQQKGTQEAFLNNIHKFIEFLLKNAPKNIESLDIKFESEYGNCPSCKDGYIRDVGNFYGCSNYRNGCKFTLPKKWAGKKLTKKNIKDLITKQKTDLIIGFKKKKGGDFNAYLTLKENKIEMEFPYV